MTDSPQKPKKGSGHGAVHWMMQRVTAAALLLLAPFTVILFVRGVTEGIGAGAVFGTPFAATVGILLFGTGFYHSYLGVKVIIEDYISCPCGRLVLINLARFAAFALAAAVTVALILIVGDARAIITA